MDIIATHGPRLLGLACVFGFFMAWDAGANNVARSAMPWWILLLGGSSIVVGAVLGVGLARGIAALNLRVIATIIGSWLVTLPAHAGLSVLFFFSLKAYFTG